MSVAIVTQLLTMGQLYQCFPAAQLAVRPDRRHRKRWQICILFQLFPQLEQSLAGFTDPTNLWLRILTPEANYLPVDE